MLAKAGRSVNHSTRECVLHTLCCVCFSEQSICLLQKALNEARCGWRLVWLQGARGCSITFQTQYFALYLCAVLATVWGLSCVGLWQQTSCLPATSWFVRVSRLQLCCPVDLGGFECVTWLVVLDWQTLLGVHVLVYNCVLSGHGCGAVCTHWVI
jgi:hypothetical protein